MAVDWENYRLNRAAAIAETGQFLGILDRNWEPVMPLEGVRSASFAGVFADTGAMTLELEGELERGIPNPAVDYLVAADAGAFPDDPASMMELFHSAAHIIVERDGGAGRPPLRRVYRVTEMDAVSGRDCVAKLTVRGVDMIEHLKHLPCWADPSNHSMVMQLQYSDIQSGSAEEVARKIIGRNLIGYQQPSLLLDSTSWTSFISTTSNWRSLNPNNFSVIFNPRPSGLPSEHCVVVARWDNAFDLLKPTFDAAGLLPVVDLWLPGDPQPFPDHGILALPTAVVSFAPRSTVSGAVTTVGQGIRSLRRRISADDVSESYDFADVEIPGRDGRPPWVVFDVAEGATITIRKSTAWRFLVGGKSPAVVNSAIKTGLKVATGFLVSLIPGVGPAAKEAIVGGAEIAGELAADRFLNLNEMADINRGIYHGRSRYISLSRPGEANSTDAVQKIWTAKGETAGGLALKLAIDDPYPYVPGVDFDLGDTVGVRAMGRIWAAFVSDLTWTIAPESPVGWELTLGDRRLISNLGEMFAANLENVRSVAARLITTISK